MFGVFGASVGLDAFIIAMRIPNLFREMLAEGSLGSAFTKVFSEVSVTDSKRAKELMAETLWMIALLVSLVCLMGILAAPWLIQLMTIMANKEHSAELITTSTQLARVLFPVLGFMVMGAVIMGALHQRGKFFLTATAPILFNLGYIVGALVIANAMVESDLTWITRYLDEPGITGLAFGVLLGAFGQMFAQLIGIWKPLLAGNLWPPRLVMSKEFKQVLFLMAPMMIAASAAQINQVVVTNFSTSLGPGTVTRLMAAFRLLHLPVALFAVAIGVTALPSMTKAIAQNAGKITDQVATELQNAIELVLWFMVPCLVFYLASSTDLISFLFQSGKFTSEDVAQSSLALNAYAFAFLAYGVNKVLQSFYFATNRTKYPMKMSLITIGTNLVFLNLFIDRGIQGLAIAFACSLSLYSLLLIAGLSRTGLNIKWRRLLRSLAILAASGVLAYGAQLAIEQNYLRQLSFDAMWLQSGIKLSAKGLLTVLILVLGASLHLKTSPLSLLRRLKRS